MGFLTILNESFIFFTKIDLLEQEEIFDKMWSSI